jgi:hypothetical protein
MVKEMFVKVYEIDLYLCYLHILIVVLPCRFNDFYRIYKHTKEGVSRLKMIVDKTKYITMFFFFHSL